MNMAKRSILLLVASGFAPLLTGCLPMMALSAADLAVRGVQGNPVSDAALQPQARDACSERAAPYGAVNVIDVEQHRLNQIIVWGTVDNGKQKRSFECDYSTRITGFTLRPIARHQ